VSLFPEAFESRDALGFPRKKSRTVGILPKESVHPIWGVGLLPTSTAQYRDIYRAVLIRCQSPDSRSRRGILMKVDSLRSRERSISISDYDKKQEYTGPVSIILHGK